jgi:hypothetical protein
MSHESSFTDRAADLGREHGRNAASWAFDGNTAEETYRRVLQGIEDGDPAIVDLYREPGLSGEFADDYTSSDLMFDLGIEDQETEYQDELCLAWENAATEAFWDAITDQCRKHVPPDTFARRRDGIAYLMADGDLRVPCSRYGRSTAECAPVAWRVAYLVAREQGEPVTREGLDHAMGLVVNDHDDVAYIVNAYGQGWYGRR